MSASTSAEVAICIAGVARTFPVTAYNTYRMIVEPIRSHADVFLAIDLRKGAGTFGYYVSKYSYHSYSEHLKGRYSTATVTEWAKPVRPMLNAQSFANSDNETMTLRSCLAQVTAHEKQRGFQYKWMMRVRPDMIYTLRMPPYEIWPSWVPNAKIKQMFTSWDSPWHTGMVAKDWILGGGCNKGGLFALVTRSAAAAYFNPWPPEFALRRMGCGPPLGKWPKDECRLGCALHRAKVHVASCSGASAGEVLRGHLPDALTLQNLSTEALRATVDNRVASASTFEFRCAEFCDSTCRAGHLCDNHLRNVTFDATAPTKGAKHAAAVAHVRRHELGEHNDHAGNPNNAEYPKELGGVAAASEASRVRRNEYGKRTCDAIYTWLQPPVRPPVV